PAMRRQPTPSPTRSRPRALRRRPSRFRRRRRLPPPRPPFMSLDLDWMILVPILLGHAAVWIVITNVTHAVGLSARGIAILRLVLATAILGLGGIIVTSATGGPPATWHWAVRVYAFACVATVCFGVPAVTLLRMRRQIPEGILGTASELDLARAEGRDALVGA